MDYLISTGRTEMFIKFTTLLEERTLPLSNNAYLLFCDVAEWFSLDSTRDVRYSDDGKLFEILV